MSDKDRLINNIKEMKNYTRCSFLKLLKKALLINRPIKKIYLLGILGIICLIQYPIIHSIQSNNTLDLFKDIVTYTNNVVLIVFSAIITGYALFQAILNKNTLKVLFLAKGKSKTNNKDLPAPNLFMEYNLYFLAFGIMCLISIVVSYVIIMYIPILKEIENKIYLEYRNYIAFIAFNIYIIYNLCLLLEIKSFIYNLFKCFNISAIDNVVEELKNWDENLDEITRNENSVVSEIKELQNLKNTGAITISEYDVLKKKIINAK